MAVKNTNSGDDNATTDESSRKNIGLSPELSELVVELRESTKRIDPRKHNVKSLRRALSLVSDILADIDRATTQKP